LKQHSKTHQQQKQHQQQQAEGQQWQQHAGGEEAVDMENNAVIEPMEVPVSVPLTQVIPYLETIRVEYY
jgi:hypothetical protein